MTGLLLVCLIGWTCGVQVLAAGRSHQVPAPQWVRVVTTVLALAAAVGTLPRLLGLVT